MKFFQGLVCRAAIAAFGFGAVSSSRAVTPDDLCPVCGQKLGATVYGFTKRGRTEKIFVCASCAKLDTACYICGVPVKDKFLRLADGRLLCEDDAGQAVLTQDEAGKIFDDVKREAQSILSQLGSLPHHNIQIVLQAKARLDKTGGNVISAHEDRMLMGLTRSTGRGEGQLEHAIYLLYGLTRERMKAVAVHEYGHAWLHENVRRKLNRDTTEGFCEWLAYKVMKQQDSADEIQAMLKNDYTVGQLQAFIAAEEAHGFYHVMQWVKTGLDPEIDAEHLDRILELRAGERSVASAQPVFMASAPRVPFTNLVLKGLSGSNARRFALINDGTFTVNEEGRVRLGDSNVTLRCLQIHADAAVIQVAGETEPRMLKLSDVR